MSDPMTPERLAEIRDQARPGYAITLAQLIADARTTHPHASGPVIVQGCTVTNADAIKEAVRDVWLKGVPALLAEVERLRAERTRAVDALTWIADQLSKHAHSLGGDIEDAHDTAVTALKALDGTEATS